MTLGPRDAGGSRRRGRRSDPAPGDPDGLLAPGEAERHLAKGEAALMLVECLMLALVNRGLLDLDEVLEEVETALEAKRRLEADGSHPRLSSVAAGMLTEIANSLAAGGGQGGAGR